MLQSHHHPEFAEPTTGAIAADALFVIANSYVGHFQPNGASKIRQPADCDCRCPTKAIQEY